MRSLLALILVLSGLVSPLYAADEKASQGTATERLAAIEKRLDEIEENQKKILDNQDKTFEEFRKLRIYIHKN